MHTLPRPWPCTPTPGVLAGKGSRASRLPSAPSGAPRTRLVRETGGEGAGPSLWPVTCRSGPPSPGSERRTHSSAGTTAEQARGPPRGRLCESGCRGERWPPWRRAGRERRADAFDGSRGSASAPRDGFSRRSAKTSPRRVSSQLAGAAGAGRVSRGGRAPAPGPAASPPASGAAGRGTRGARLPPPRAALRKAKATPWSDFVPFPEHFAPRALVSSQKRENFHLSGGRWAPHVHACDLEAAGVGGRPPPATGPSPRPRDTRTRPQALSAAGAGGASLREGNRTEPPNEGRRDFRAPPGP